MVAAHRRKSRSDAGALESLRQSMFGGDFVFSVDRDFVRSSTTPFLVLSGNDEFHPRAVAQEIAELAPDADLVLEWTNPVHHDETLQRVRDFLGRHTPGPS